MERMKIVKAEALVVEANEQAAEVYLKFKASPQHLSVVLDKEQALELLCRLAPHISIDSSMALKPDAQFFAVRNAEAILAGPQLPTLRYELECGLRLQTTIEPKDAARLRDELTSMLEALPPPSDRPN